MIDKDAIAQYKRLLADDSFVDDKHFQDVLETGENSAEALLAHMLAETHKNDNEEQRPDVDEEINPPAEECDERDSNVDAFEADADATRGNFATIEETEAHAARSSENQEALHAIRERCDAILSVKTPVPERYFETNSSFSWDGNLVPAPQPLLWQDVAPHVPLRQLISQEARQMVSIGRLYSHYRRTRQTWNIAAGKEACEML